MPRMTRTVPRFQRSARVYHDTQQVVESPAAETGRMLGAVRSGIEALRNFVRPAAEQESIDRGTAEALDDFREGRFQKRKPYTVRSQAYNAASDRVIGAKVRTAYSQGLSDAINGATSEADLQQRLNALVDESMGELGDEFSGIRQGLEAQGAAMFEMTRGRFRRIDGIVARDRAAASEAVAATRATTRTAARTGEVEPDAAEAISAQVLDNLAAYGPPDTFRVGDREFPADPRRPGTLTVEEIEAEAETTAAELRDSAARATVERAQFLAPLIADLESSRPQIPADMRGPMLRQARTELARRNGQRRAEENAAVRTIDRLGSRPMTPDVPSPPQLPIAARMTERAARRQAELALDWQSVPREFALEELERARSELQPAGDAEAIEELTAYLDRIAELTEDGRILDDPDALEPPPASVELEHGRRGWGQRVNRMIAELAQNPPRTAEEAEDLEAAVAAIRAEGQRHARTANVDHLTEARALDRMADQIGEELRRSPVAIARNAGHEIAPLDLTNTGSIAESLLARSEAMATARDAMGFTVGVDLSPDEATAIAEHLTGATGPERVAFLEAMKEIPMPQRRRIGEAFREVAPNIAAAFTAAGIASLPAARAIDQPPAAAAVDAAYVTDLAGEDAAQIAADLAFVGVPNAELEAIRIGAPEPVSAAVSARLAPEDVDAEIPPAASRRLARGQRRPFESEPDPADALAQRVAADPELQRLARAQGYVPDSPEAVQAFSRLVEDYEATPAEERPAFLEELRTSRTRAAIADLPRPLYYSGEEVTIEGLQKAAERIVREHQRGVIDPETYADQARLIQRLVEELNG